MLILSQIQYYGDICFQLLQFLCHSHFFLIKVLISGKLLLRLVSTVFVAKLLISGILFSTAVNAVFVAKLLISGILPSISVTLAF